MSSGDSSPVSCVVMWHDPHGDSHPESHALQQYFIRSCHGLATARRASFPILRSLGLRFTYARSYVVVALRLADDVLRWFRFGLFVFGVHRMAHLRVVVASLPKGASTVWHCL